MNLLRLAKPRVEELGIFIGSGEAQARIDILFYGKILQQYKVDTLFTHSIIPINIHILTCNFLSLVFILNTQYSILSIYT